MDNVIALTIFGVKIQRKDNVMGMQVTIVSRKSPDRIEQKVYQTVMIVCGCIREDVVDVFPIRQKIFLN